MAVYALVAWGIIAFTNAVSAGVGSQHVERIERVEERKEEDSTYR